MTTQLVVNLLKLERVIFSSREGVVGCGVGGGFLSPTTWLFFIVARGRVASQAYTLGVTARAATWPLGRHPTGPGRGPCILSHGPSFGSGLAQRLERGANLPLIEVRILSRYFSLFFVY